jgi:hypothetical protein
LIEGFTTSCAPADVAPEMILTAVPWDRAHAVMVGFGPM